MVMQTLTQNKHMLVNRQMPISKRLAPNLWLDLPSPVHGIDVLMGILIDLSDQFSQDEINLLARAVIVRHLLILDPRNLRADAVILALVATINTRLEKDGQRMVPSHPDSGSGLTGFYLTYIGD